MVNFYQWCKTPSSAFSKKFSPTTPNFLHVFGRVGHRSHTRISYDSLRITRDRLSQGIFSLVRLEGMHNLPLVAHHFQVDQCARQQQWMGTEGSEGRWVRQACIGRSVILNYQVCRDGGCYIPTHCPRLPTNVTLHYRRRLDGWTARCAVGVLGCVWGGGLRDEQTRVRVRLLPVPLVSPTMPPRPRAAATHGSLSTDGRRVGGPARGGARRRSTAHEDDAAAVLRTVPRCN